MSHTTAVADTSVLIDLERGSFLVAAFTLSLDFRVPDVLYDRELKQHGGGRFLAVGLKVERLNAAGIKQAKNFQQADRALSRSDAFALSLACQLRCLLLTGDARLRKLANAEGIDCHGVLWLLDLIHKEQTATSEQLCDGLTDIRDHPRCRLPMSEVNKRLNTYSKTANGN